MAEPLTNAQTLQKELNVFLSVIFGCFAYYGSVTFDLNWIIDIIQGAPIRCY